MLLRLESGLGLERHSRFVALSAGLDGLVEDQLAVLIV